MGLPAGSSARAGLQDGGNAVCRLHRAGMRDRVCKNYAGARFPGPISKNAFCTVVGLRQHTAAAEDRAQSNFAQMVDNGLPISKASQKSDTGPIYCAYSKNRFFERGLVNPFHMGK